MKAFALRVYDYYKFVFDSKRNPIRHIPDPVSRFYIMTILAGLWSFFFFHLHWKYNLFRYKPSCARNITVNVFFHHGCIL